MQENFPARPSFASRWWMRYCLRPVAVAGFFVYITSLLTLILQQIFPYPFLFLFFGAVMGAAWFGGALGGVLSVLFSTLVVAFFFVPPYYSFTISPAAAPYFVSYVLCAALVSWIAAYRRRADNAVREARDQLELRVEERTAELEASYRELAETQASLAHVTRVLSMSQVTAALAHEINQPLAAIVTNAYACLSWLKQQNPEKAEASAEKVIRDGTRAGEIVTRLRSLFQRNDGERSIESVNAILFDAARLLREESKRRQVAIRLVLADQLPPVYADAIQLEQAVLNLALNGMDAMAELPAGEAQLLLESARTEEGDVLVRVIDAGAGIEPGQESRIFDAFYTTKPSGLGMGLSISRTIIEAHEGRLWAEPRREGGSIFQFTIPAAR